MELPKEIKNFNVISDKELPGGQITRIYEHIPTSILFQFVRKGKFRSGFSEQEEEALQTSLSTSGDEDSEAGLAFLESLDALRPCIDVAISSFLLALNPLTWLQIKALLGENRPEEPGIPEDCLSKTVSEQIIAALNGYELRLPTEAEWEYTYRAGTCGPFPWGVIRPESPWAPENRFGFEGMGEFAELCADTWQIDLNGASSDGTSHKPEEKLRVVRGGAAEVWPWQDMAEWVTMLSAYRSSCREHDGFLKIRPACTLP